MNPERSRQLTGGDTAEEEARNPDRPVSMALVSMPDLKEQRAVKRISSPEKWEMNRLIAANVIDKSELPDFDEETGIICFFGFFKTKYSEIFSSSLKISFHLFIDFFLKPLAT